MTGKAALFGGALMAAGMTANAQQFNFLDSYGTFNSFAQSFAYGGDGASVDATAPASLDTMDMAYSPYTGTTTMSTTQSPTELRTDAQWAGDGANGYGYGFSQMQQFFQVSQDADLIIEWDVTGTDGYASGSAIDITAGSATLFSFNALSGQLSGTETVSLQAGVDYAAVFGMIDPASGFGPFIFSSTETQFISMTLVPAPGAAGLFGIAGLAAVRRRR